MLLLRTDGANAVSHNAPLIGALVALGGVFTAQMVSIALDDRRTQESRSIEERRAQEARELEAQRAHEAALEKYFDQVGKLLIEKPLYRASPHDHTSSLVVRTVVRAQTLAVLEGLDPGRKRVLLQFLYESGLIAKDKPEVQLESANLRGANLAEAKLIKASLTYAHLRKANLSSAHLEEADLTGANLTGADLSDTNLIRADLEKAILVGADLRGANLRGANLSGSTGMTNEELEQQACSLEGAVMPDGSKHP
jgi:hypothetical protein